MCERHTVPQVGGVLPVMNGEGRIKPDLFSVLPQEARPDAMERAVGVSGAPGGERDEVCAQAGIDKVADQLK